MNQSLGAIRAVWESMPDARRPGSRAHPLSALSDVRRSGDEVVATLLASISGGAAP